MEDSVIYTFGSAQADRCIGTQFGLILVCIAVTVWAGYWVADLIRGIRKDREEKRIRREAREG